MLHLLCCFRGEELIATLRVLRSLGVHDAELVQVRGPQTAGEQLDDEG